ncbi:solute carrier family 23 protein [Aestuariivirga sp.]|uniref:solute carrier family 23 protein n=1 Tax=Aestuariivirga sp. TaxID=2650926 RepID=UPI0035ADED03
MAGEESAAAQHIRYEPDEKAPQGLAAAMAAQTVLLILAGIMLTPLVIARGAGASDADTSWMVFAALVAAGVSTWLQLIRKGPIGSGYVLFVGSNVAFVGVSVAAYKAGGIPLLATLGAVGALTTFAFTRWLPMLRAVLTPAVGGTVLMLMALSVGPVIWKMLSKPLPGAALGAPHGIVFLLTLGTITVILLFGKGMVRLWAPLIGVALGTLVGAWFGHLDVTRVVAAPWLGIPGEGWPGIDLSFDARFWSLIPAFALLSLVGCMETYADGISAQRMSHRKERPIDFRSVQGAINADGTGSIFAALLGTVPNTVFSTSLAVSEITGVASRRVGLWGGLFLILLAFSPKIGAAVAAIPSQVVGAYILILVVIIFGHGIRLVNEEGLGFEVGLAVCLSFWVGLSAQSGGLMNEIMPAWLQTIFSNGTTVGGVTAMILMLIITWRRGPQDRVSLPLSPRAVLSLNDTVARFARRVGWDERAENRLMLAVEEAVIFLCEEREALGKGAKGSGRLVVRLKETKGEAEVEMVTGPSERNLEELVTAASTANPADDTDNLAIHLLARVTRELKHLQYTQGDYLQFRVDSSA